MEMMENSYGMKEYYNVLNAFKANVSHVILCNNNCCDKILKDMNLDASRVGIIFEKSNERIELSYISNEEQVSKKASEVEEKKSKQMEHVNVVNEAKCVNDLNDLNEVRNDAPVEGVKTETNNANPSVQMTVVNAPNQMNYINNYNQNEQINEINYYNQINGYNQMNMFNNSQQNEGMNQTNFSLQTDQPQVVFDYQTCVGEVPGMNMYNTQQNEGMNQTNFIQQIDQPQVVFDYQTYAGELPEMTCINYVQNQQPMSYGMFNTTSVVSNEIGDEQMMTYDYCNYEDMNGYCTFNNCEGGCYTYGFNSEPSGFINFTQNMQSNTCTVQSHFDSNTLTQ